MAQIQGLEFIITSDISGAVDKISSLSTALTNLKNASKGGLGLGTAARQMEAFGTAMRNIDLSKLSQFADAVARMGTANPKLSKSFVDNMTGLSAALHGLSEADIEKMERLGDALSRFPQSLSLRGLGSVGRSASREMGVLAQSSVNAADAELENANIRQTTGGMSALSRVFNVFGETINGALGPLGRFSGLLTGLGSGVLSRVRGLFTNLTSKIKGFFNSIKRIAFYRLIRSVMRMITQGFTEGLKNMYAYSQTVGTQFAGSMDKLATSALYLKNSLASIAAPLINALAPAIDYITDKIVALFNLIAQFIARLTGNSTYTAAKKVATTWQDAATGAVGGAKDAVDEFRRYVLGFDELNILGQSKSGSGSGGGGGGAGGLSGADMFEERTIDDGVSKFADSIREAFENHDWEGLGQVLGQGFNDLIDRIPWAEAGEKVGTFLNGVFATADSFFQEADFVNLGNSIAEFVNKGIEQADFSHVGGTVAGAIEAAVDTVGGLLGGLNWEGVGKAVTDTLSGFFERSTGWMNSHDWEGVGKNVVTSAEDFFNGGDWNRLASSLSETIGTALRSAFTFVGGVVKQGGGDWFGNIQSFANTYVKRWESQVTDLANRIRSAVEGNNLWELRDAWTDYLLTILHMPGDIIRDWFSGGMNDFADWWNDNVFSPLGRGITENPNFDYRNWAYENWYGGDSKWYSDEVHRNATGRYVANVSEKLTVDVSLKKDGWTTLDDYVGELQAKNVNLSRGNFTTLNAYVGDLSNRTVNLSKGNFSTLDKYVGNLSAKSVSLSKNGWSTLDNYVGTISAKPLALYKQGWNSLYDYTGTKVDVGVQLYKSGWTDFKSFIGLKNGGIVTNNGAVKFFRSGGWIEGAKAGMFPAYAGGAVNAGSVFVAGEAGPELVAHVNGRSEVLNASQIASTMYQSTVAGMKAMVGDIAAAVNNGNQTVVCEVYLDRDRIATAVSKGQQANNRRYSSSAM